MLPGEKEGYKVLAEPPGYEPIRTPARKLMATPTPFGGTPMYAIPEEDRRQQFDVPAQLEGLPEMKPEDAQYFGKLLKVGWAGEGGGGGGREVPQRGWGWGCFLGCGAVMLALLQIVCAWGGWAGRVGCAMTLLLPLPAPLCLPTPASHLPCSPALRCTAATLTPLLCPLQDVDEGALSVEEAKERKIMKLLLKVKNGTPPQRKSALRQLTGEWVGVDGLCVDDNEGCGLEGGRRATEVDGCSRSSNLCLPPLHLLPPFPRCPRCCRQGARLWRGPAVQPDPAAADVAHAGGPGAPPARQGAVWCGAVQWVPTSLVLPAPNSNPDIHRPSPASTRPLATQVIDRVLFKLDELVRPYVHKILVVIEPLLIDEDYYARVEGRCVRAGGRGRDAGGAFGRWVEVQDCPPAFLACVVHASLPDPRPLTLCLCCSAPSYTYSS